jgi:hypothetical protein
VNGEPTKSTLPSLLKFLTAQWKHLLNPGSPFSTIFSTIGFTSINFQKNFHIYAKAGC